MIEGGVGVLQQYLRVCAVLGKQGNADTATDGDLFTLEQERLGDRRQNTFRNLDCVARLTDLAQDNDELVTAQSRQQVLGQGVVRLGGRDVVVVAQAGLQALSGALEHQIADAVTEGVVDALELVQVQEQDGQRPRAQAGGVDRFTQAFVKHDAVGQAGQVVIIGQEANAFLGLLARGNVLAQPDVMGDQCRRDRVWRKRAPPPRRIRHSCADCTIRPSRNRRCR